MLLPDCSDCEASDGHVDFRVALFVSGTRQDRVAHAEQRISIRVELHRSVLHTLGQ